MVQGQVVTVTISGPMIPDADLPTPTPTAGVRVMFSGPQTAQSVTDRDGYFSARIKAGTYSVTLGADVPAQFKFRVQRGPGTVTVQASRTTSANYYAWIACLCK
jgi:hypothetical protein